MDCIMVSPQSEYEFPITIYQYSLSLFTTCVNGRGVRGDRDNIPIQVIFLDVFPNPKLCAGGVDEGLEESDEVFAWVEEEEEWEKVGEMREGRSYHAVSTIQMNHHAMQYCNPTMPSLKLYK